MYTCAVQGYSPLGSPGSWFVKGEVLASPILNEVADRLDKSPAQIALRWGLQNGNSVLPKSTDEIRIKENFDVFGWDIPEELFAKFSEIEQASIRLFLFSAFLQFNNLNFTVTS